MEGSPGKTDAEVWETVREVLFNALETVPGKRKAFLDQSCQGDPNLRAEVESLIAASESPSFIDAPAMEAVTILRRETAPKPAAGFRQTIAHYELLGKIGEGGMGDVYKAMDKKLDRIVALKVLPVGHNREEYRQRFAREAKAASALNHPNIVTIYEFGSEGKMDYIAMEYVEGFTLHTLLAEHKEPLPKLLEYARQAALAIGKAHAAGIVHRDLKPANIMITPDGVVKILDFGLASLVRPEQPFDLDATRLQELTRAGAIIGTPPYMSPEQAMGERTDPRTDIFSFGIILYEIVCGRRPFGGVSSYLTLHQVTEENPIPVKEANPQLPDALASLVEKCLSKKREERPQVMAEVERALAEAVAETKSAAAAPPMQDNSFKKILVGVASGLAVCGTFLAYLWWPAPKAPVPASVPETAFFYSIETQKMQGGQPSGDPYIASPMETFDGGWKFRIAIQSPEPGYLYLINQGPDRSGGKRYYILYPGAPADSRAALGVNESVRTGWYVFDGNPGTERLWIVWSAKPLPTVELQLKKSPGGSVETPAAANEIDTLLSGLKQGVRKEEGGRIRVASAERTATFAELLDLVHR